MHKRAQITVFIILGILVIAIFGFMFYITQEVSRIKLETEANKIVDSILATTPLNYYVTLCLEESTKRAINISGRQGGPLYPEDYIVGVPDIISGSDKVSYSVVYIPGRFQYENQYPCSDTTNFFNVPPAFCGFVNNANLFPSSRNVSFGAFYMKSLCREGDCGTDSINVTVGGVLVRDSSISGADSIQKSLERYIANQTDNCSKQISNISAFQAFNVTAGNISVNITFGYNGVEVIADYPLIIKIQDVEPVIRILKFNYFSPVRFKSVYRFARHLAEEDNVDLNFDIAKNWTKDLYAISGFAVNLQKIGRDTIVKISDNDQLHLLKNGPFVFQFVIQNRPPVLDYIREYARYDFFLDKYLLPENQRFDFIVSEGDTIQIFPKAKDPDGDSLSYSYSGWKENYDEIFDETKATNCREVPTNCITKISTDPPKNFTISPPYVLHGVNASYKTNHTDIGPHNLTICAYETGNEESKDCQTIRILVDDVFVVLANITKCYLDISNKSLVSIEDPVCLRGDVIDYFNPGITTYRWKILPSATSIYEGASNYVVLPRDYQTSFYVPGEISYFQLSDVGLLKTFEVGVQRGATQGTDSATSVVRKCLPHRTDEKSAPYPFNNIQNDDYSDFADPFYSNHTCCLGDPFDDSGELWDFAGDTAVCYNYTQYGLWDANFLDIKQQAQQAMSNLITSFQTSYASTSKPAPSDENLWNDVMKKSFISHCSGENGNICSNDVTEQYEDVLQCPDTAGTQFARCQGASAIASESKPSECQKYSDTTFEKITGKRQDTLCDIPRCTDASRNGTNSGYNSALNENSYFLCSATCSSGNCQKPAQCRNCRIEFGNPGTKEGGVNYVLKQEFSGTVGACSLDDCTGTKFVVTDSCNDEGKLVEYFPRVDYDSWPEPYGNETVSCSDSALGFETAAEVSIVGGIETCTPGNLSSCSDGACLSNQQTGIITGACTGPSGSEYKGVKADDIAGNKNGIEESCAYYQVSYTFSEIACKTCYPTYNWNPPNSCTPP